MNVTDDRHGAARDGPSSCDRAATTMWVRWFGDSSRRRISMRYLGPLCGLIFMVPPVARVVDAPGPPSIRWLGLAGLALFSVVWGYLITRGPAWSKPRVLWAGIVLLMVLALVYTFSLGSDLVGLFFFVSVLASFVLPPRQSATAVAVVVLITVLVCLAVGASLAAIGQIAVLQVSLSFWMLTTRRLVVANARLEEAREDVARLAVSEERLRFARDLHDLLGHSLSAIALKTELARRLVIADPLRAEREIGEVEALVREALREVREAVAGYRQPRLADELSNAREVLSAAGVAYLLEGRPDRLPPAVESALAWIVREGITNVVRHSGAKHCTIRFTSEGSSLVVEILDDGRGSVPPGEDGPGRRIGTGLQGLTERVALLGGSLTAGPLPSRGFRLRAMIPLPESRSAERRALGEVVR